MNEILVLYLYVQDKCYFYSLPLTRRSLERRISSMTCIIEIYLDCKNMYYFDNVSFRSIYNRHFCGYAKLLMLIEKCILT